MKQKLCLLLALLLVFFQIASAAMAESLLERLQKKQEETTSIQQDAEESGVLLQLVSLGEQPEITIEEGSGGFWFAGPGSPEGNFTPNNSASAKRTNIIPITPGDQLAYKGSGSSAVSSVVWLEEDMDFISDQKINSPEDFTLIIAPDNAEYAWFQSFAYTNKPEKVVLEVQWILCQEAESKYSQSSYLSLSETYEYRFEELEKTLDQLIGIVTDMSRADVLYGKKIIYDGDSICSGVSGGSVAYPRLIAEMTEGLFVNMSSGGSRLSQDDEDPSVVNNLEALPVDGDLYCFEGGILDYWANVPIGECVPNNYTGAVDPATLCGAMETIFRHCLENLPGKPVCFVIPHKIQATAYAPNKNGDTFQDYRNAMIAVCEKYSIPYYDAFTESGLNGWHDVQNSLFLTGGESGMPDGLQPNTEGYKHFYVPQLLDLFRRIMPVE